MSAHRKLYLSALLTEAVRILKEQDPAVPPAPGGSAVPPSPVPPAPATNGAPPAPAAPPVDPNAAPAADAKPFDVDSMIERLNVIRGGKSFADPEVYGQLTSFFKTLSDADKAAIDKFLQSIGKVVIQVDASQQGTTATAQPPMNQGPAPVAAAPTPAPAPGV